MWGTPSSEPRLDEYEKHALPQDPGTADLNPAASTDVCGPDREPSRADAADPLADALIHGIDFTSAPRPRKPIVIATGRMDQGRLLITSIDQLPTFEAFEQFLRRDGPWIGAFDFPFGLSRELVVELGWPASGQQPWASLIRHLRSMTRSRMVEHFRGYCDARPAGSKFAHRATDGPAGSSPSMKWVNPPVALMLHAGAPRLLDAGVTLPGQHDADPARVALEGYPGNLARVFAARRSYKSDSRADDGPRRAERERILAGIIDGPNPLGVHAVMERSIVERCRDDPSGDVLDAVLCALQAAWAWQRRAQGFGLPPCIDPIEGWIVAVVEDNKGLAGGVRATDNGG